MQAAQADRYGDSSVIKLINNATLKDPKPNQVLVENYAVGLNPFDWKLLAGYLKQSMPLTFPTTLGGDFAGKVIAVGNLVESVKVGDDVYGSALVLNGGSGALAESVIANESNLSLKPPSLDYASASALPLVGASAIQSLEDHIKLSAGQKILIHGGAGGIGHLAIQIAKYLKAYVITTVKASDISFVKNLGADEILDYQSQAPYESLQDLDAVFDTVGGDVTNKSIGVLKKGGVIVSMAGQPDEALTQAKAVTAISQFTKINTVHLTRLTQLIEAGGVKVNLAKTFPLSEVQAAFHYLQQESHQGKVIVQIK